MSLKHVILSANQAWNIYNFRRGLLKYLIANGYKISILAPWDSCSPLLIEMGCEVFDLPMSSQGINPWSDFGLMIRMFNFYRKLKPDLVINYTIKPNIYGSIAARFAGIPCLAVTTGLGYTFISNSLVAKVARKLYKFAFRYPVEVWFLNQDDRQAFISNNLIDETKAIVLQSEGIDTEFFSPQEKSVDDGKFRFLLIARMLWDKGVGEYVEAASLVKKIYPNATFQLLGATGIENPSAINRSKIIDWEESGLVEYLGTATDVRPFISAADCLVLPSYREGVSRTLMEGASMAKPLIATDVPGCRDVVKNGISGLLCEAKNVSELKNRMIELINFPVAQRNVMGNAGRKLIIDNFSEKIIISKYIIFLKSLKLHENHNGKKIIISVNTAWNIVNFRFGLIRALIKAGFKVVAVAPTDEYAPRLAELGCRFVPLPMENQGTNPARDVLLLWRFVRLLKCERPDMYLGYTVKPNVYGSLAAHWLGIPVINNIAGLGAVFIQDGWLVRLVRGLYKLALGRSVRVFFQNPDDRQLFIEHQLVKVDATDLLPGSGVDLQRFLPVPLPQPVEAGCKFRFLLIARMLRDKGVVEYVQAARKLKADWPDVEWCLLGFVDVKNPAAISGEQMNAWVQEGVVNYWGVSDDVRLQIAKADCVVLPSYREGTPRTLLEAAAMARPIITTDAPGCRGVVDDGQTGFLCKPRDAADLAEKMRRLLMLPQATRSDMGQNGRRKMEREFDEQIVIQKYLEAVHSVAQPSSALRS